MREKRLLELEHKKRWDAQTSPARHTSPHGANCSASAKSVSSIFLQSLSCLRIRNYHWVTLCAVTGGDNSAVMSKRELDCLLTEERRDNLQVSVCINMCPKFLTRVLILKLGFWHSSSSPLLTLYSLQHHLSPLTILIYAHSISPKHSH